MPASQSRRDVLRSGTAAAIASTIVISSVPTTISAAPVDLAAAITRLTGGAKLNAGKVKIDLPPLSENGNTVPIGVTVESPMTPASYVKAVHVLNEKNPQPNVISAWFTPRSGQATLQTRIRLSDTQMIVAIAELSDGTFWTESANVIVTLGACLEELI